MFTSYAQNFEDVMLWRAFKDLGPGLYIDIGAQDPIVDSVSFAFYKAGWRGLNVEPTQQYADLFREARPDDQLVQAAVSKDAGPINFYEVANTGLSTGNAEIARSYGKLGQEVVEREVECMKLADLFDLLPNKDINWLKIDVEGMEHSVIQSWGDHSTRPWVVVVESTKPNSHEPWFEHWEPELIARGYRAVYSDGLNRFYVHEVHDDLAEHFTSSPNVFDDFTLTDASLFTRSVKQQLVESRSEFAAAAEGGPLLETIFTSLREENRKLHQDNAVLQQKLYATTRTAQVEMQWALEQQTAGNSAERESLRAQLEKLTGSVSELDASNALAASAVSSLRETNEHEISLRTKLEADLKLADEELKTQKRVKSQDDRILHTTKTSNTRLSQRVRQLEAGELALQRMAHEHGARVADLTAENVGLREIRDSSMWKLTYPLRRLMHPFRNRSPNQAIELKPHLSLEQMAGIKSISSFAEPERVQEWKKLLSQQSKAVSR